MSNEPSRISRPEHGGSGLTDPERFLLADLAVERVMRDMDVSEETARALLGHAAEHDRVTITGDRQLVGLFVDDHPLVLVDRARLRGLVHPASTRAVDADALAYFPLDGYMVGRVEQRPAGLSGEEQAELLTRARVS